MIPEEPFQFIKGTVKILICSTDKAVYKELIQTLSNNPLYEILLLKSIKDVVPALDSKRYHVGIIGSSEAEIDILKRNYKTFYLIIPTGTSFKAGYWCAKSGAKGFYEGDVDEMVKLIWKTALMNILNPLYDSPIGYLAKSTDVIMSKDISSSTGLALELGISERHLWNIWNILSITPKKALMINGFYKDAYEFFEKGKFKADLYKRQELFFRLHEKVLLKYILI